MLWCHRKGMHPPLPSQHFCTYTILRSMEGFFPSSAIPILKCISAFQLNIFKRTITGLYFNQIFLWQKNSTATLSLWLFSRFHQMSRLQCQRLAFETEHKCGIKVRAPSKNSLCSSIHSKVKTGYPKVNFKNSLRYHCSLCFFFKVALTAFLFANCFLGNYNSPKVSWEKSFVCVIFWIKESKLPTNCEQNLESSMPL